MYGEQMVRMLRAVDLLSTPMENELDGSIILEMETCGWFDIKKWVLSHGSHAELLEPREMRDELFEEVKSCFGSYGDCPPSS